MKLGLTLGVVTMVLFASSCGESSTTEATNNDTMTTTEMKDATPMADNTSIEVPVEVKTEFEKKYPTVTNVKWRNYEPVNTFDWEWAGWPMMESSDYAVNFNMDGHDHWAWYDRNNNWIGTVSSFNDVAGLPAAVNKTLQTQFAGYNVDNIDKENDKNRTAYELDLTKGEDKLKVLIDENGNVMKKKGMVDGEKMKEKNM